RKGERPGRPNKPLARFVHPTGIDDGPRPAGFVRFRKALWRGRSMIASFWMVVGLACAQFGGLAEPPQANGAQEAQRQAESVPPPKPATSKIVAVTVYQGQALVTREVSVPEGDGTVEMVVTPLPARAVDSSLYTEGADGLRVLSTRFRTRAV